MQYLPPFEAIKAKLEFSSGVKGLEVSISYDEFTNIIKLYLRGIPIDENWYYNKYPDVKDAVEQGAFKNAAHHFIENGYFEGRLPFELKVNKEWYIKHYDDVREGINTGRLGSALNHFIEHGYIEGRLPDGFE